MLRWTFGFLITAIAAAVIGFTEIATGIAWIAQIVFVLALMLAVISLGFGAVLSQRDE